MSDLSEFFATLGDRLTDLRQRATSKFQDWVTGNPDEAGARVSTLVDNLRGLREELVRLEALKATDDASVALRATLRKNYIYYCYSVFGCVENATIAMYGREAAAKIFEGKEAAGPPCVEVGVQFGLPALAIPAGYVVVGVVAACAAVAISASAASDWATAREERLRQEHMGAMEVTRQDRILDAREKGVATSDLDNQRVFDPALPGVNNNKDAGAGGGAGGLLLLLGVAGAAWFYMRESKAS